MRAHVLVLLPLLAFAACSKDETPAAGTGTDAGAIDSAAPPVDGSSDAATSDAPPGPSDTALEANINGVKRPLDRAQFGTEQDDAGAERFYIEAHAGGDPACPDPDAGSGTSPERTLVLSGVPRAAVGKTFTKADGVAAAYFDFVGDQLTGSPLTKATAVTATIVAVDAAQSPKFVEVDVDATFAEGTVKGRIHAEYCASMSQ